MHVFVWILWLISIWSQRCRHFNHLFQTMAICGTAKRTIINIIPKNGVKMAQVNRKCNECKCQTHDDNNNNNNKRKQASRERKMRRECRYVFVNGSQWRYMSALQHSAMSHKAIMLTHRMYWSVYICSYHTLHPHRYGCFCEFFF